MLTDPPQQGPRVPDRLLPVPVERGLDRRARTRRCSTTRRPTTAARSTSAARTDPAFDDAPAALRRRGARRGAAPRLRGADPGAPPGGGVVGELVREPGLAAGPAAVRRPTASSLATAPSEQQVVDRVQAIAAAGARHDQRRAVHRRHGRTVGCDRRSPAGELGVRTFDRTLDSGWRRTSYTGAHRRTSTRPTSPASRRTPGSPTSRSRPARHRQRCRPIGHGVGAAVGRVCRWPRCRAGPASARSSTPCSSTSTSPRRTSPTTSPPGSPSSWRGAASTSGRSTSVVAGLVAAIETPLGPLAGDARLRDVGRADRLDELGFELPLVGGDTPTAELTLAALADVLDAHVGAGDPLAGYATRLRDPLLRQQLRGYLTGSLDLVAPPRRRRRHAAVRRRRLQDQLARRRGRGADGVALPPRRAGGGDAPRPLPAAGAVLRRRPAPLPALAAPRLPARTATSPACSTCSSAG